jgi:hypothetical protein
MGHADEGAAIPVKEVDLNQARTRGDRVVSLPAEAVGEAMDRNDLAELPTGRAAGPPANVLDQIEAAGMDLGLRLGAHPAQDLVGIGQEGEDGRGRSRNLSLAPDNERLVHLSLLIGALWAAILNPMVEYKTSQRRVNDKTNGRPPILPVRPTFALPGRKSAKTKESENAVFSFLLFFGIKPFQWLVIKNEIFLLRHRAAARRPAPALFER